MAEAAPGEAWLFPLRQGQLAVVVRAGGAALVLLAAKYVVWRGGFEFIDSLPLMTGLMGGVVFTLAILLASVLNDFKEAERIVGELVSVLRRLHFDTELVAKGERRERMRREILALTRDLRTDLASGDTIRLRGLYAHVEVLDKELVETIGNQPIPPTVRTYQVSLGQVTRILDRLEVIVETTFVEAGYWFAGAVVALALLGLTFTRTLNVVQDFFLFGFAAFLLVGVYWLIAALDHPFAGGVRLNLRQVAKFEAWLAGQVEPGPR